MRRNHSEAGGRTESSTELIARLTAERNSRTTETTTRTAVATPTGSTALGARTPQSTAPQPTTPSSTATMQVTARPAGRHHSADADDVEETAVIDRVTQLVADRPIPAEEARIEQDGPDEQADEDRDFYPAPGRPARRRSARPIARRLAPLAIGAAVMLVATTAAALVQPSDDDQVASPELSGQVIADRTPPPNYLDQATLTPAPTPAPVVTPPPAPVAAPPPAPKPAAPKPAAKDEGVSAAGKNGWKLAGGDEFNGNGLSDKWGVYDGAGHDGKGRREPGQVSVQGGNLVISGDGDGNTGGVSYKDGQKFGKWEMRAKYPSGDKQYHPVLILWPDSGNWPADGEIDFAETNSAADDISFFLHYNASNEQVSDTKKVDLTQWHNYAVEWVNGRITGYIDGVKWFESTDGDTMPPGSMHPTIQLDYFPSGGDLKPSQMLIDYMRVYQ
jgi:Glycosyl hydrolases family 16